MGPSSVSDSNSNSSAERSLLVLQQTVGPVSVLLFPAFSSSLLKLQQLLPLLPSTACFSNGSRERQRSERLAAWAAAAMAAARAPSSVRTAEPFPLLLLSLGQQAATAEADGAAVSPRICSSFKRELSVAIVSEPKRLLTMMLVRYLLLLPVLHSPPLLARLSLQSSYEERLSSLKQRGLTSPWLQATARQTE